jgi:pimeloyl-ACP methyl ester carboxylesterase
MRGSGWMHMQVVLDDDPSGATEQATTPPSMGLFLTEPARGAVGLGSLLLAAPWLARAPRGTAHGVLVLPGLLATDLSTGPLRRFLRSRGHVVTGWGLGRNVGPTSAILDGMPRVLRQLADATGAPVSVIGWSLGGIYARELGRHHPEPVRQVLTLGSPFALTDARQSRADAAFQRRGHLHAAGRIPSRNEIARPIPVRSTAVYSRRDGIVAWQACIAEPSQLHENIEVRCAHLGLGVDPAILWLIADRLAQPPGHREPFRPPARLRRLYPGSR